MYFMKNMQRIRNDLEPYIATDRLADWDFIYIEVFSKITKEYFWRILTQNELLKILHWAELDQEIVELEHNKRISEVVVK